jgi:hypothetical protein
MRDVTYLVNLTALEMAAVEVRWKVDARAVIYWEVVQEIAVAGGIWPRGRSGATAFCGHVALAGEVMGVVEEALCAALVVSLSLARLHAPLSAAAS